MFAKTMSRAVALLLAGSALPSLATAQVAPTTAQPDPNPPSGTSPPSTSTPSATPPDAGAQSRGNDAIVAGDIVVTATKRAQNLRNVPATVAVLSADRLQSAGAKDLFQAVTLIPGTTFSRAPDDGLQLTIRGLGSPARTQSFDQSVALFLDGAFLGKGRLYSTPFFDVERIEVIKGTQSTLLGKNTSLGAISIVSHKPGDHLGGYVTTGGELEYGGFSVESGLDVPISDTLKTRISGRLGNAHGWVHNDVTGNDVPIDRDLGLRAIAAWTPSQGFDATVSYQYAYGRRIGNGYQYVDPQGLLPAGLGDGILDDHKSGFVSQGADNESVHRTRAHLANLTTDTKLGDHTLTTVSSYDTYKIDFVDDFDFGPKDATYFRRHEDYWQIGQEVRISSPDKGRLTYIVGGYFFYSDWKSSEQQNYNTPLFIPPLGGNIFQGTFTNNFNQRTRTLSGFASGTYRFTDRVRLNLGLRYTDEWKHASYGRVASGPLTPWNQILNPPFAQTPLRFHDNFLNGNASLQVDLADTITAYAGYGRGTKTGGFAESAAVPTGDPRLPSDAGGSAVRSERADSWEVGIKGAAFERHVNFELAGFYTHVHDFQDTTFTGASFDTANLPARSYGAEASGQWKVTRTFQIDGAATYAKADILAAPERPVPGSPRLTGYAGGQWEDSVGSRGWHLFANTYYRHRGPMVFQRVQSFRGGAWNTVDAAAGLKGPGDRWEARASVRNLFNDLSTDFSGPPADPTLAPSLRADAPSPFRTVRIDLTFRF